MEEADTVCQPALPRRRLCSVSFLPGRAPRARLVRRPETVNVDEARVETGASSESRLPPANANQAGASCARMPTQWGTEGLRPARIGRVTALDRATSSGPHTTSDKLPQELMTC